MMMPRMRKRSLYLVPLIAGIAFAAGAQTSFRLPDLGSSAAALISPTEEQAYGADMLHQMRAMHLVLDDPLVDGYVSSLGYRLVAVSDEPKQKFTFFVVRDSQINSFAAPGGYVGVNAGLIIATHSESELAAVMAHEIAHITQHHLERAFEDARKTTPLLALALLGAIAAGAAGGSNGNAPIAILAGGEGLVAQRQLNFTRHDEEEADRVGIGTLARAGFDPEAMARFFQRMQEDLRPDHGSGDLPQLLQTHPVTSQRISEAEARAHVIEEQMRAHPPAIYAVGSHWQTSIEPLPYVRHPGELIAYARSADGEEGSGAYALYALMRERVRVLMSDQPNTLADYYARNLRQHPTFNTPANHYGYALTLIRLGDGTSALRQLEPLLAARPDNLPLRLATAHAELVAGARAASLQRYAAITRDWPRNHAVALAYAKALLADGKADGAPEAAHLLKPLLDDADEPDLYRTYGRAADLAGQPIRAAEAYADATFLAGQPADALDQLQRLAKRSDLDYYQRARIEARIAWITPIVLEMRKRHLRQQDGSGSG